MGPTMSPALPTSGLSLVFTASFHVMTSSPRVLFPFNALSYILPQPLKEPYGRLLDVTII